MSNSTPTLEAPSTEPRTSRPRRDMPRDGEEIKSRRALPSLGQRARRVFLIVHLWIGLILGAWFALMGITGSIIAWRFDISAYEWRSRFPIKQPAPGARMIPLSQAVATAQKAYPDMPARALTSVRVPRADLPFYIFPMGQKDGVFHIAAVDPYTGEAYPPAPVASIITVFEELHTQLLLKDNGNTACGIFAFFAVFLMLSGLWLWWPNNAKVLKTRLKVKWDASLQRRLYDLHNVMGIYLFPLLLLTTITAVQMVGVNVIKRSQAGERPAATRGSAPAGRGENAGGQRLERRNRERGGRGRAPGVAPATAPAAAPVGRARSRGPAVVPTGSALSMDDLIDVARKDVPGYELVEVSLPQRPTQAFRVMYRRALGLTRYGQLYINPYNGKIVERTPIYNTEGDGDISQLSQGIHYGAYGGVATKLLYTVTGLMPAGLFVTGLLLWWRKKRRQLEVKRKRKQALKTAPVSAA